MIEKLDREKMREKAQRATPGPWRHGYSDGSGVASDRYEEEVYGMLTAKDSTLFESFREDMFTDCEFVAAFNPQAALQLLDQIDELEARIAEYAPVKEFYGPAGLKTVSELILERDDAREEHLAEHQAAVDMFGKYLDEQEKVKELEARLANYMIEVGEFRVSRAYGGNSVWICRENGEGMEIGTVTMEKIFKEYM